MKIIILYSNFLDKNFLINSLTFINFRECVVNSCNSQNKITLQNKIIIDNLFNDLKIGCLEIVDYDPIEFDIIICDFDDYLRLKNNFKKKIIFRYSDLIKNHLIDYNINNICLKDNTCEEHLSHNVLYDLDSKKNYFFKENKLYDLPDKNYKNKLFVSQYILRNFIFENEMISLDKFKEIISSENNFPYKIVKNKDEYYKKYLNKVELIDYDILKNNLDNVIGDIKVNYENIKDCVYVDKLELHFTILILSYNNEKYTDLCLQTALNQNYKNFNVLFINCNSTDKTFEISEKYALKYENLTIINQTERVYQTENFLLGTLLSEKDSIIVSLDGDDWLSNYEILNLLNDIYFSSMCLLTYGSYNEFPYRNIKWAWKERSFDDLRNIRKKKLSLSHLRTWQREFFLNIDKESLKIGGEYPKMSGDVSVLLYLVEMYPEKCQFISAVLYNYNRTNVLSDSCVDEKLQIKTAEHFFNKKSYQKLEPHNLFNIKNDLLFLISHLEFSLLKMSLIDRYLNYQKSKYYCSKSFKVYKNTDYYDEIHLHCNKSFANLFFRDKTINYNVEKLLNFFDDKKIKNYKQIKKHNLYSSYGLEKKENKLGIIILSCRKRMDHARQKIEKFKQYYDKNIECKIFVGGNSGEIFEINDVVYLNIPDNYESLPLKVSTACDWFFKNYDIDYIFKTDEDIFIDFPKLYNLFYEKVSNKILYGGNVAFFIPFKTDYHFNKCESKILNKKILDIDFYGYYCSGGGYFVNKKAFNDIYDYLNKLQQNVNMISEDLNMGIAFNEHGILPTYLDYFKDKIVYWEESEIVKNRFCLKRKFLE